MCVFSCVNTYLCVLVCLLFRLGVFDVCTSIYVCVCVCVCTHVRMYFCVCVFMCCWTVSVPDIREYRERE